MVYELFYWPGIQGRGEFVRLTLEDGGADYIDHALQPEDEGGGVAAILSILDAPTLTTPPFGPPFLKAGHQLIGQTANILDYLGPRLALAPEGEVRRRWVHQLQLTLADLVSEVHETHHPIASSLFYQDQKPEARRRAADFIAARLPKYLDYFERVLERNPESDHWLVGAAATYVDLSLAQVVSGLRYAFPRASRRVLRHCPRVVALHERAFARPRVATYLASPRRLPFCEDDIFRHYPELDR